MKRFLSFLLASWFIVLVVVAQHRGFYVAMALGFFTAVALVVQRERYREFGNRNSKRVIVTLLSCMTIAAFVWQANVR